MHYEGQIFLIYFIYIYKHFNRNIIHPNYIHFNYEVLLLRFAITSYYIAIL